MSTRVFLYTAGTVITAGAAYAIYFDYKRRNDPEFRRQIRVDVIQPRLMIVRERRQIEKKLGREQKQQADASKKDYRQAWLEIKDTEYPKRPDEMEQFFLAQITQAEQLVSKGPSMYLTAAQYFYKALKVYPSAPELLDIYKKTVPEAAFDAIMGLKEADESDSADADSTHSMD